MFLHPIALDENVKYFLSFPLGGCLLSFLRLRDKRVVDALSRDSFMHGWQIVKVTRCGRGVSWLRMPQCVGSFGKHGCERGRKSEEC